MNEHTLICIVGRTGAGKSRLAKELSDRCGYRQIISYTTRAQRNEQDLDHIFVDEEAYQQAKLEGILAAETIINGFRYWTTTNQLYENDLYVIDPKGIESLRALKLPGLRLVTIYINTSDDARASRALKRGDQKDVYMSRNLDEKSQFRDFLKNASFDYAVLNDNFANAYSILKWICDVEGVWKNKESDYGNCM